MDLGVISRSKEYWATKKILAAIGKSGHKSRYIHTPDIQLKLGEGEASAYANEKSLGELDSVIPRIGRSLTEFGIMMLRHLELMRVPTTLSSDGLATARNKFLALQGLVDAGVKIPSTVLVASRMSLSDMMDHTPPPFVMKLLSGTQGIGVIKVEKAKDAGPIMDTLVELRQLIAVQRFLPNPGEDIRALIIGDQMIGCMKRKAAKNEWRSNIHLGGKGVKIKLSSKDERMAIKAAQALKVEIAGVDLIETDDGFYVIEVNASPGFQGLQQATGVDVGKEMVEYAVAKAHA